MENFFRLLVKLSWGKKETLMEFLWFVGLWRGLLSAVERMMADSLMRMTQSGLSMEDVFEQISCMSFVWSDRKTESRSWMSTLPKDGWKRSKEVRHGFFMFLTCGGSCTMSVASR